jgi:alkylhydroperoxidase/carboxymuconolactone decarboxylase family protein YurZ
MIFFFFCSGEKEYYKIDSKEANMEENPLSTLEKLDPKIVDHLKAENDLIYSAGALPKKYKLIMAMAFDAAHGAQGGVRALAQAAMREGATTEEIAEAIRVAYHLSGVGALYTASLGLKGLI